MTTPTKAENPSAALEMRLKVPTGYRSTSKHTITLEQWAAINLVIEDPTAADALLAQLSKTNG